MLPDTLIRKPIDSWGPELQKRTAILNEEVEHDARQRIFGFLFKLDPTFSFGGAISVKTAVNSGYAK